MKAIKHFILITTHKWYVMKNCFKAGLYWQGITHDLSKYTPTEFFESVKYFTGTMSPLDKAKRDKGYSNAYLHHMGRNKHHFEHWVDDYIHGGRSIQMPFKYALELVCDYLAAGQIYMKKDFSYEAEYKWWQNRTNEKTMMHPQTKKFIDLMMEEIMKQNSLDVLKKENAKVLYNKANVEIEK